MGGGIFAREGPQSRSGRESQDRSRDAAADGNGPELWLNMQQAYDLWHAEREMAEEIAKIPTHGAA